jgi:hypothetical protein
MPRDLNKSEYGMLQLSMVQITTITGRRPTVLMVHPLVQEELGVSLSLFALEHRVTLRVEPRLRPPMMVFANPLNEEREPWQR